MLSARYILCLFLVPPTLANYLPRWPALSPRDQVPPHPQRCLRPRRLGHGSSWRDPHWSPHRVARMGSRVSWSVSRSRVSFFLLADDVGVPFLAGKLTDPVWSPLPVESRSTLTPRACLLPPRRASRTRSCVAARTSELDRNSGEWLKDEGLTRCRALAAYLCCALSEL